MKFYTTKEGGNFYPLVDDQRTKSELVQVLETNRVQVPVTPERGLKNSFLDHLYKPPGQTWCSYIDGLEVFVVLFPDATVWDSVVGGFYSNLQNWCEEVLKACREKYL